MTSRVGVQVCLARGRLCGCSFPTELGARVKTTKISFGASCGSVFVCTGENFPLCGIRHVKQVKFTINFVEY